MYVCVFTYVCECFVVAAFPSVLFTSKGTAVPWTGPGMLAKHFSSVCFCVCHFGGGESLTVIKVKRPTVLVRGRGEKEGERGKREMDR